MQEKFDAQAEHKAENEHREYDKQNDKHRSRLYDPLLTLFFCHTRTFMKEVFICLGTKA